MYSRSDIDRFIDILSLAARMFEVVGRPDSEPATPWTPREEPIETAPVTGELIFVHAPGRDGLPPL
jgi:hypothetical protein